MEPQLTPAPGMRGVLSQSQLAQPQETDLRSYLQSFLEAGRAYLIRNKSNPKLLGVRREQSDSL